MKTLEEFSRDHQPPLRRDILAHFGTTTWIAKADNVELLRPPGVGKTHLAIGLGVQAIHAGYSGLFDAATGWVARLAAAHGAGRLEFELKRLRKYKLLIIAEIDRLVYDSEVVTLADDSCRTRRRREILDQQTRPGTK